MDIYLATIRHPSHAIFPTIKGRNSRLSLSAIFPFSVTKKEGQDIENNVANDWLVRCLRWLGYLCDGWNIFTVVGRGWLGDLRGVKDGCVGVVKMDFFNCKKVGVLKMEFFNWRKREFFGGLQGRFPLRGKGEKENSKKKRDLWISPRRPG